MDANETESDALLRGASEGDESDLRRLLELHRPRLRRMVAVRLDGRLSARVDPSDVVQETLADAARKLPQYVCDRPLPFYPWLRRLAEEQIIREHRRHLRSLKRGVERERRADDPMLGASAFALADRLAASGTSPSRHLMREEMRQRLLRALGQLADADREVLVLRYLEGLAFGEIAEVLLITENAAKVRHFRALERVRKLLGTEPEEER
jgi:RNA polymerase sigma-70 factor, ECF subfamily